VNDDDDLMADYHGDEPYPDDDHNLGEHEGDPDPDCRLCREALRARRKGLDT
jgi:hypothetical protein